MKGPPHQEWNGKFGGERPAVRPRQDSNLRTRLRRPVLYPLSYEGGTTPERSPARARRRLRLPPG